MSYSDLDLSILKTITTNKKYALDFVSECSTNLLSPDVWAFSNLVVGYIKTYRDVPTINILVERVNKTNPAFADTVRTIWTTIEKHKTDDKEYAVNIEKIKNRFAENEIVKLKETLSRFDHSSTISKPLNDIEKTINTIKSLTTKKTYERKTLKDSVDAFKEEINAKLLDPSFDAGALTGYSFLDNATDGLRPGELLIIAGETGGGKSLLLSNISIQMWMQNNTIDMTSNFTKGYNVLYFSLEMPFKASRNRIYSRISEVPSKIIRRPMNKNGKLFLTSEHRNKLNVATRFMKNYPYQFEIVDIPRGATAEGIELLFEEATTNYRPDIIAIDYLGIMDDDSKDDDWLKLGVIAGKISEICRVHNIIGLTAVQLNRAKTSSKDSEDKIGSHRIGRSALILTHANIGLQIETRQNEKSYPNMVVHIIKNRDGENMLKGSLLKNLACGSLIDDGQNKEEQSDLEFKDVDDISEEIALFDI